MTAEFALPSTCAVAFKEWAGVCDALGAESQSLLLRKGGIAEGPGGFEPEHRVFWLYPTHVHEAQQGLRTTARSPSSAPPAAAATVPIRALALVEMVAFVDRLDTLNALADLHVWTPETVEKRFHYRRPGVWVLGVPAGHGRARGLQDLGPPRPAAGDGGARPGARSRRGGPPARISPHDPQTRPLTALRTAHMLRGLIDDAKQFPATVGLGVLWVVVFILMLVARPAGSPSLSVGQLLIGNVAGAHRFGDMTLAELFDGQVWRTLTCTFVHYNVLHIGMNLYGLYQLGSLVESWYGPGQFLAVYVLIGSGGNLLSGLIRRMLGSNPLIHSGGGSTVVLGLVGLCAVVGWRARTRIGDYLRGQMVKILVLTALLGIALPIIDNWGHAGGAMVGGLIGLAHRVLGRWSHRRATRWAGLAALVLIAASGASQVRENRVEDDQRRRIAAEGRRLRTAGQIEIKLNLVANFYRLAALRAEFDRLSFVPTALIPPPRSAKKGGSVSYIDLTPEELRTQARACHALLDEAGRALGAEATAEDRTRAGELLDRVLKMPPNQAQFREFHSRLGNLISRARRDRAQAQARYQALARGRPLG
jgi:membrane associated rhomboid family serine protease